jgi:hypothetical protein
MAQRRQIKKPQRRARPPRQTDVAAEELALAEELLRVSREEQAGLVAGWEKFMEQLGIKGKPIPAKKLHEMAIKEGIDPNDNQFSRGIIEMREE